MFESVVQWTKFLRISFQKFGVAFNVTKFIMNITLFLSSVGTFFFSTCRLLHSCMSFSLTVVLQCLPLLVGSKVKVVPNMTYNVFGGKLNPTLLLLDCLVVG